MILFSRIVATTDSINLRALRRIYPARGKVHLIPTGSNFSPVGSSNPISRSFSAAPLRKQALVFGLIRSGKGIDSVVNAFERSGKLRNVCELHIAGSLPEVHTADDLQLLERIKTLSFVRYHGYLSWSQLRELFSAVHFFVLPFAEGLSERRGSFMAAMAAGKPVVTVTPAIPIEGLVDGHNVLYLNDSTSAGIERRLLHCAASEDENLARIGANARLWYESNFSDDMLFIKLCSIVN